MKRLPSCIPCIVARIARVAFVALAALGLAAGCGGQAPMPGPVPPPVARNAQYPPQLPDTTGWGVHVLALAQGNDGSLWAGSYAQGLFYLPPDTLRRWTQFAPDDDSTAIGSKFINSVAVASDSVIWYGSVGDGFGYTTNRGRTWHNWNSRRLGREWVYVAPSGIVARADTVYIATADGLRISRDGGRTWRCIQGVDTTIGGTPQREAGCSELLHVLPTKYLLSLAVGPDGAIWVGHLKGASVSHDDGRSWTQATGGGVEGQRVRALYVAYDSTVWAATETGIFIDSAGGSAFEPANITIPGMGAVPGGVRAFAQAGGEIPPIMATSYGMVARETADQYRIYYLPAGEIFRPASDIWAVTMVGPPYWPIGGAATGLNRVLAGESPTRPLELVPAAAPPEEPRHQWFRRPIDGGEGNPYIDATYRYGSTMAGNLQQHQGVEFNNPAGTPVHAVGDGVVVFAGKAEQGANTVAILHDRRLNGQYVFSTYFHNTELLVRAGQRVSEGDVISRVGNTGRAGNDHLHLEIHVAPTADSAAIVNAAERFPAYTRNPQLWIAPIPGTGIVAGRVVDSNGELVQGAQVHGLVQAYPEETPFSYAETYRDRAHGDPAYNENFAVGDIPPGDYVLGVDIEGKRVWRRVHVAAGRVTFVEFAPAPGRGLLILC
jgi:murein DD-endopeptidase MepM/ murein hydrolase activator NlpD/sugar lactone lactonase YvrE